jgi:WD40 repeat protein
MKLINVETQRFIDNITSITPGALKGGLGAIDRHPLKDELLAGGADGAPKIYKMYREQDRKIGDDFNLIRAFGAMPGRIFDVTYSNDGERIAAGSSYNGAGQVRIYKTADGAEQVKIDVPQGGIFAVSLSPDGARVASGGFDGYVRIHDAQTGSLIAEFPPVPLTENIER